METSLIGFPLSGKTTIFNAITGQNHELSFAAGSKKEVYIADVEVPDRRIDKLTAVFKPKKKVYATVRFKEIPLEFAEDNSISSASLAELRNADALTIVIRAFKKQSVPHPQNEINPVKDFNTMIDSLILSDYIQIEKRLERLAKEAKTASREFQILQQLGKRLEQAQLIGEGSLTEDDLKLFSGFAFLTAKPVIVIINLGEESETTVELEERIRQYNLSFFKFRGDVEMEIAQLPEDEQREFLLDLGLQEPARTRFISHIYDRLKLISFLTAGEDEVRAWSIKNGLNARQSAGKIHTDLEKGFIRAEVIDWRDLAEAGGFKQAKADGKMRLEGKDYPVKDGDVLTIRFNV